MRIFAFCAALCVAVAWQACESQPPKDKEPVVEGASEVSSEPAPARDASPEPSPRAEPAVEPRQTPEKPPQERQASGDAGPRKTVFGGKRPVTLKVPAEYDHSKSYPLLVVLHGYGASGAVQSFYMGANPLVDAQGILMLAPDGTVDPTGKKFWNATDACCDFGKSGVDDVAYIRGLIEDVKKEYNVDPKRIYLLGHSNGGFMSYRMACEAPELIAGIVSLAGATYHDASKCAPSQAVNVLQIHGTKDSTIKYAGGTTFGTLRYPSTEQTVSTWATYNKCTGKLAAPGGALDLDTQLAGDDTDVQKVEGCPKGGAVELWKIKDGAHIPKLVGSFGQMVWDWMKAHPKP